jgi:hypothetical protein
MIDGVCEKECKTWILTDLSNAFGTVCTSILLRKFQLLGVRGVALDWLKSALTGRSQCVKLRVILRMENLKAKYCLLFSQLTGVLRRVVLFLRSCLI